MVVAEDKRIAIQVVCTTVSRSVKGQDATMVQSNAGQCSLLRPWLGCSCLIWSAGHPLVSVGPFITLSSLVAATCHSLEHPDSSVILG